MTGNTPGLQAEKAGAETSESSVLSMLRQARGALGLSTTDIGEALGYSRQQISAVERGERALKPGFLHAYVEVLRRHGGTDPAVQALLAEVGTRHRGVPYPRRRQGRVVARQLQAQQHQAHIVRLGDAAASDKPEEAALALAELAEMLEDTRGPESLTAAVALAKPAGEGKRAAISFLLEVAKNRHHIAQQEAIDSLGLAAGGNGYGAEYCVQALTEIAESEEDNESSIDETSMAIYALRFALGAGRKEAQDVIMHFCDYDKGDPRRRAAIRALAQAGAGNASGAAWARRVLSEKDRDNEELAGFAQFERVRDARADSVLKQMG